MPYEQSRRALRRKMATSKRLFLICLAINLFWCCVGPFVPGELYFKPPFNFRPAFFAAAFFSTILLGLQIYSGFAYLSARSKLKRDQD